VNASIAELIVTISHGVVGSLLVVAALASPLGQLTN